MGYTGKHLIIESKEHETVRTWSFANFYWRDCQTARGTRTWLNTITCHNLVKNANLQHKWYLDSRSSVNSLSFTCCKYMDDFQEWIGTYKHGWQISRHWLAGNSYFPCSRIFISSFSEPLGINIEGLLLGIQLFIQIWFDGRWCAT